MNYFDHFPLICSVCIGDKKFINISKKKDPEICLVTKNKYTGFYFKYENKFIKKTIISQDFAFIKQICQICLKPIYIDSRIMNKRINNKQKDKANRTINCKKRVISAPRSPKLANPITTYCGFVTIEIEKIIEHLKSIAIDLKILEVVLNRKKKIIYVTFFNLKHCKKMLIFENVHNLKLFRLQEIAELLDKKHL